MQAAATNLNSLYNSTMNETLWPTYKRIIYCSVSGRPWGQVSEEYVQQVVMSIGSNAEQMKTIIDRMTLFNGPSPLWQSHVPLMLEKNKLLDPAGFLVYMLNIYLKLQYQDFIDLEARIQWRHDTTHLYKALTGYSKEYINAINDIMLMLSGEGFKPPLHVLPSKNIADYINKETLDKLILACKLHYNKRKNQKNNYTLYGNQVHKRTYLYDNDLEDANEDTKNNLYRLMLTELFQKVDAQYSKAEIKRAKSITGIASPTHMNLDMDYQTALRTKVNPYKKLQAPVATIDPSKPFMLGKKQS